MDPLAMAGLIILICMIALLLTKKVSVHFALTVPAIIGALLLGIPLAEIGSFAASGLSSIASTAIMLIFAVLFFGVLFDAGMFDPIIKGIIRFAGGDPAKIALGTAVIASICHLDGSGSITFLITCSALLPVYNALKMSLLVLATSAGLAAGVMNLVPWGGPTIRVASALSVDVNELFVPLLSCVIVGLLAVYGMAYLMGLKERKRLGILRQEAVSVDLKTDPQKEALKRPKLMIPNLILCVLSIAALIFGWLPMAVVFVITTVIAMLLNYPDPKEQQQRIAALAPSALYTATVIFSAGVFTGIFKGSGMLEHLALAMSGMIPASLGGVFTPLLGLISPIALIFIDVDSYYYGVLPVLASVAEGIGISGISVGRAMLMGQHIFACMPLTGSSWLLCSLAGIDMGDLQKKILPRGLLIALVFVILGVVFGFI